MGAAPWAARGAAEALVVGAAPWAARVGGELCYGSSVFRPSSVFELLLCVSAYGQPEAVLRPAVSAALTGGQRWW